MTNDSVVPVLTSGILYLSLLHTAYDSTEIGDCIYTHSRPSFARIDV